MDYKVGTEVIFTDSHRNEYEAIILVSKSYTNSDSVNIEITKPLSESCSYSAGASGNVTKDSVRLPLNKDEQFLQSLMGGSGSA